jgi:nicotinamidase-related amidase
LVLIDFQDRLVPAMAHADHTIKSAANLLAGFEVLGLPYIATQQYTKGLGETVAPLKEAAAAFTHIEKEAFNAMTEPVFVEALAQAGRKNVVLCGVEAHICVLQSALSMVAAGYNVFLVTDAIDTRAAENKKMAIKRAVQAGVVPATVEMVLFELLEDDSKSPLFKAISKIIK